MTKLLITTDCNGHEYRNPYATLVIFDDADIQDVRLKELECRQLGACRRGGSLQELLEDCDSVGMKYVKGRSGRMSDFSIDEYDREYRLISGNY